MSYPLQGSIFLLSLSHEMPFPPPSLSDPLLNPHPPLRHGLIRRWENPPKIPQFFQTQAFRFPICFAPPSHRITDHGHPPSFAFRPHQTQYLSRTWQRKTSEFITKLDHRVPSAVNGESHHGDDLANSAPSVPPATLETLPPPLQALRTQQFVFMHAEDRRAMMMMLQVAPAGGKDYGLRIRRISLQTAMTICPAASARSGCFFSFWCLFSGLPQNRFDGRCLRPKTMLLAWLCLPGLSSATASNELVRRREPSGGSGKIGLAIRTPFGVRVCHNNETVAFISRCALVPTNFPTTLPPHLLRPSAESR
ncbi:uncharacterized protein BO66DRAFT_54920 [Aspergillus aculeatinus CBS 121060]|uniref:Uncharacterized protein n=1 Tax=Aspergillus aculeatinus CBS 121060 TaxID=1448322 RepID=A0ACD1HDP8_9EURO|nr:hypothetical protein BO66DRAFT_54920 [Aspergillus aculeatinus CBS 121060]RAH71644.1 hypothetical protein BO66DRAFT_54920 [Aspergillus aculeatinus CBS 121060]